MPLQQFFRWQFRRGAGHSPKTSCPPTIAFRTIPGAAHARGASAASTPCPSTLPSRPPCCGDRFFAHAPAPGRPRTKLPGERQQTAHEIWARRSGHFSMPATALHRSESYLSVPWHLSMPRVGPWKAPRHEPASRARPPSSHRPFFTLLRSSGSENFRELGPSARVRILGLRNHGFSSIFGLKHIQHAGAPTQSTRFVILFVRRNSELAFARSTRVLKL